MPHWKLFDYKINISISEGVCHLKVISIFDDFNFIFDEMNQEFLKLKVETTTSNEYGDVDVVCEGEEEFLAFTLEYGYFDNHFFVTGVSGLSYYNDKIYNKDNIEGFYMPTKRVFLRCYSYYESSLDLIEYVKPYRFNDNSMSDDMNVDISCVANKTYGFF